MRRPHNEDCFGILEQEGLVLVADGMGGHAAGEVASALAVTEVGRFFHQTHVMPSLIRPFATDESLSPLENRLGCGIRVANQRIFEMASGGRRGMGTTIVAAAVVVGEICIAHIGDSRAYRIHEGGIDRLTRDHSLLEQFKELYPEMTREEEENFPQRNVITRALGLADNVEVDIKTHAMHAGDRYVLCSDGLSGHVTDEEMCEVMLGIEPLEAAVAKLVELANEAGGSDNITLVGLAVL